MSDGKGGMTVKEAGQLGGATRKKQMLEQGFTPDGKIKGYFEMGRRGGARVKELIEAGKRGEKES